MIEEEYVTFETAKLLKKKGFDEYCRESYSTFCNSGSVEISAISDWGKANQVKRPSQALAIRWLREKHNKYIDFTTTDNGKGLSWQYEIVDGTTPFKVYIEASRKTEEPTYEECAEQAIRYCLENVIK